MSTKEGRENETFKGWQGRAAFILISIGSAIGFGNLWRFPALTYEYGAGAFFVPYLLALFILGIPIMTMEVAVSQYHQRADPESWATFHKRFRGIGLTAIFSTFVLMVYYAIMLCWVIRSFVVTFSLTQEDIENITGPELFQYFTDVIVGGETLPPDGRPTRFVPQNVGYYALTWFLGFMSTAWGVNVLGKISWFTMGLPLVLLFVFLGKALSLEGASDGLYAYLGNWDFSILLEQPQIWSQAAVQIFFSLSLVTGILTALGSHCERNAPCAANSMIVSFSNSTFSFIAGMAIFASLGFQANTEGVPISELQVGGPGLLFGSYPAVFLEIQGGIHWVRLYYINLFLLGISSLNGLLEAIIAPLEEMKPLMNLGKKWIVGLLCIAAFICGLIYCTDAGLLFLDVVDFYINYIFLFLGFVKCFEFGWLSNYKQTVGLFGWKPLGLYWFSTFGSVFAGSIICFCKLAGDSSVWVGLIVLVAWFGMGMTGAFYYCRAAKQQNNLSWKTVVYSLMFQNAIDLQSEYRSVVGWLPPLWTSLIKHVNTPVILTLFVNLAAATTEDGKPMFGHYGGLVPWPYQVLGLLVFCTAAVVFLAGLMRPQLYMPLKPDDDEEEMTTNDVDNVNKSGKSGLGVTMKNDDDDDEYDDIDIEAAEALANPPPKEVFAN